jgi:hypothetical protein
VELAARVRALCGRSPLTLVSAVSDRRYEDALGTGESAPATGYTFSIARHYASRGQAAAFQAMLDRLQALNVIAWTRAGSTIEITVASDASHVIVDGALIE